MNEQLQTAFHCWTTATLQRGWLAEDIKLPLGPASCLTVKADWRCGLIAEEAHKVLIFPPGVSGPPQSRDRFAQSQHTLNDTMAAKPDAIHKALIMEECKLNGPGKDHI